MTFIDIHILQDVPPANLNRDQGGSPKTAVYGGVPRLRVSSQAWKRATRLAFGRNLPIEERGVRTRRLQQYFTNGLAERGVPEETGAEIITAVLATLGIKAGKNKAELLSYLLFCGRAQLNEAMDKMAGIAEGWPSLTAKERDEAAASIGLRETLAHGHPLDVALFGRMVADLGQINVDAATQVAHALSTHAAVTQFDYFTAVDDIPANDKDGDADLGAGMIGTVEFNSGTLYRFATVAFEQLEENLGDHDAAIAGLGRFIDAFATSMPTGHQNSFAARTRPALIAVVVRQDQPVNLVSAFESPIASTSGYMAASQQRLAQLAISEAQRWGDTPILAAASYQASGEAERSLTEAFGASKPLPEVIAEVQVAVEGVSVA